MAESTTFSMPALVAVAVAFAGYLLCLSVYRLFLSPIAGVPGPKIAALTAWYEFWWDCPKQGHFMFKIREMHDRYGPIVRINPWEVHIDDPLYFDTLYSNNKLDKDGWYYRAFGSNGAAVGTPSAELHRARRGAMAKFFSAANVAKLEPKVLARVRKLCDRIEEHRREGKVVDISNAYRCLATDVISDYAAPHTRDFLSTPDFSASFNKVLRDFSELMLWHRHFPIVFPIMTSIPRSVIAKMDPTGANVAVIDNQADLLRQAQTVVDNKGIPQSKSSPTVLDSIYTSPLLSASDKTVTRILDETQAILGAGTETTGNTLSVFTYHVLSNPRIHANLRSELSAAVAARTNGNSSTPLLDSRVLEQLPYLNASIREALRIGTGVSGRLPRLHPSATLSYTTPSGTTHLFPPGTVVSMSLRDLHFNASIYPSPAAFSPERWLDADAERLARMNRAYAPFGRGVRGCVGVELAKEEVLLATGNLFARFEMELFATTGEDVSVRHDYFAPFGPKDSKGVRVVVK